MHTQKEYVELNRIWLSGSYNLNDLHNFTIFSTLTRVSFKAGISLFKNEPCEVFLWVVCMCERINKFCSIKIFISWCYSSFDELVNFVCKTKSIWQVYEITFLILHRVMRWTSVVLKMVGAQTLRRQTSGAPNVNFWNLTVRKTIYGIFVVKFLAACLS